ncbi:glycosyltransferase [Endozoicomonas sp. ALB115]|uniref:glycosyltransferase n=1 Tax=Endozoicomonas sp. ALB115 TaxID=3403074 RepID=UPI003BB5F4CE
MKYRIGLLIDSLIGGGAERVTLNFAEQFSKMGHDVHIFLVKNEVQHVIENYGYQVHSISENGVLAKNKLLNKIRLSRSLKKKVLDIENQDGKRFLFFISSAEDMDRLSKMARLENTIIRYRNSIKVYLTSKIGNKVGWKKIERTFRWKNKFKSVYSNRHIVTVSKALIGEFEELGIKSKSIKNIYNPFDFSCIRNRAEEDAGYPEEPYIIYVAKLENRKRQDVLIRAYAESGIDQKLVLLGGTYTDSDIQWELSMRKLVEDLGIKERVLFAGFHSNPYPWIKNADLFVMSSDSEGLPTVLIESLIVGTKVISTDCPTGPREILTGELADFLSEVGDYKGLAKNIARALDSYPELSEELIGKYHSEAIAEKYIEHAKKIFG